MAIREKIGIEAEYFLINEKGEMVIPPDHWDRDNFPLLGEIRGKPGKTVAETVTFFTQRRMEIEEDLYEDHTIRMSNRERIPLKLYRKANKQVKADEKENALDAVKNIYDTDITEFSDQIIEPSKVKAVLGMKIQGVWCGTGLHIHFSCADEIEYKHRIPKYEQVILPIGLGPEGLMPAQTTDENQQALHPSHEVRVAQEMLKSCLYLYRQCGYDEIDKFNLIASRLNKPAIEYIVKEMDKAFFDRFAPPEGERTKFRHPGYFELKKYGFEYRSLPANDASMAAIPEITEKAFELLEEVNEY